MIEYIYFVKCPGCEDEHFFFFDDAKECAMSQLTKKPIITQVEVNRNDFGECTDSCDLGTVWSWEDMMKDVPAEPESMAFNKADTLDCDDDFFNQEFDDLDNSLDSLSDYSRKPATRITEADGREDPEEERRKAQTQRGYDSNKAPSSSSTSARDNDLENRASRTQLGYNPHQAPSKAETSARDNDLENRDAIAPDQKTISKVLVKYATLMPYDMYDKLESKAAQVLKASKPWWLKSPGDEAGYAMCVMENGGMTEKSVASKQGLRPVIEVIPADFADDKLYQPVKAMNGDWIKISDKYLLLKDPTEMVAFDALNTLRNDFDKANIKNTLEAWCEKYFKSVGAVFGSNSAEYTREVSKQLDKDAKREAFNVRKPVPAEMTVEQLVEEMEENEDTVECKWCDELFDKSECRYEVDLGWLCDRCQAAIMSRGEQLTFRENTYWDFLDEAFNANDKVEFEYKDLKVILQGKMRAEDDWDEAEEVVSHTFVKTKKDVATDIWENFIEEDDVKDVEGGLEALEDDKAWADFLGDHFDALLDKYYDKLLNYYHREATKDYEANHSLNEELDQDELIELEYPSLTTTLYSPKHDADDWDEAKHTGSHVYLVPKGDIATAIWENWITEEDAEDVLGGLRTLDDDRLWNLYLEKHFDDLFEKYHAQILEYFREEATEDFRERAQEDSDLTRWSENSKVQDWNDEELPEGLLPGLGSLPTPPGLPNLFSEELEDAEVHKANLTDCPECGTTSYDMKEQYCINCGLNL